MSAESAITSLLGTLKSISSSYRSTTTALVQQADDALLGMRTPAAVSIDFDVTRPSPTYVRVPLPPTLDGMDDLDLPAIGKIQPVSEVTDEFKGKVPKLKMPTSIGGPLTDKPPTFTDRSPAVGSRTIRPTVPTITATAPPTLSRPTAVQADPVSGTAPSIPVPTFTPFTGNFYDEYAEGMGLIAGDIAAWHEWLKRLGDQWLKPLLGLLTTRLQGVMAGTETGVSDSWESQQYDQARQPINMERWVATGELDDQPSSLTGLPTGSGVWASFMLEVKAAQATLTAASQVSQARQTLEVKHLQWAMALAAKLIGAAMELRSQEAAWRMKGMLLALEGANGALDLALKLLAFKERELALLTRYNDLQVRRTEDHLKMELTKLESLRLTLASNKQIATYNEQNVQVYTAAMGWVEARVNLFQQQIDYLKTDIAWRKLSMQAYEAAIAAYNATAKAKNAEYDALQARIKGDQVLVDAELAKVRVYEAEITAFTAKVKQLTATAQSQAADNRSKLAKYLATVNAQMDYLRQLSDYTRVALSAVTKQFAAETTEQELQLSSQQLKDQQALHDALLDMQIEQTELLNTLKVYQIQLNQAEAEGKIIAHGAGTLGGIASQAYSGLNGVGSRMITESA